MILLDGDATHPMVSDGIEIDASLAILEAFKAVRPRLLDMPAARAVVATGDIDDESFLIRWSERVTVEAATQG